MLLCSQRAFRMINTRNSLPTTKSDVSLALLLTIIAVAAILLLVIGGVLVLTNRIKLPFFSGDPDPTPVSDVIDDTADYLNTEQPITSVDKSVLEQSQLTPTRTFNQDGEEYTESEATFTSLENNTLAATVDAFDRDLFLTGDTKYRKISLYIIDEETGYIRGVAHAEASRSDLNSVREGDKFRVIYESTTGTVREVIIYPVNR